jgi:hypothetical protein
MDRIITPEDAFDGLPVAAGNPTVYHEPSTAGRILWGGTRGELAAGAAANVTGRRRLTLGSSAGKQGRAWEPSRPSSRPEGQMAAGLGVE